jgi:phosphoserine aminotransferase
MPHTTTDRILNFSAGPATLPEPVLMKARDAIWNIEDSGIGICEHSHRGKVFDRVINEAVADCREVGGIPDDFEILFLQGGATMQFAMVPMNFLPSGGVADYVDTGTWASKAIKEAGKIGNVHLAFDGSASDYDHCPSEDELSLTADASYLHYCSNNTIKGTQFYHTPTGTGPVIADMSSDMFSKPIDWGRHAMIYAGAQKNLGPAGVVLVILRRDLLERCPDDLPLMLSYAAQVEKESMLNTPPTFGIYLMGQVFKWILTEGGLSTVADRNRRKAAVIYDAIADRADLFTTIAREDSRSQMNITFKTSDAETDARFVAEATAAGMSGLKGHRSVGGIRASVYNAFPEAGCERLASFIRGF